MAYDETRENIVYGDTMTTKHVADTTHVQTTQATTTRQAVRRVLWVTLVLNLLVAVSKIILGALTGALSIAADGFHSLTDGAGNVVALIANWFASQPPDADHPYGHRRYETLAALFIGGLLLLTTWEVLQGALARLNEPVMPTIDALTFAVMLGTLMVNLIVTTYEHREGKRLRSEILLADARHTRADVWVTLSVLSSLIVVQLTGWAWLDAVMALGVVLLIGRTGWQIVSETGRILVDTAPYESDALRDIVGDVPYVQDVVRARSRGTTDDAHIDIDVQVEPTMTTAQSDAIASVIRHRLHDSLSGVSEIEVHFVPNDEGMQDVRLLVRAHADALGIATHEILLNQDTQGLALELHVEVPADLSLAQAHDLATALEKRVQTDLPALERIITHIEPAQTAHTDDIPAPPTPQAKGQALIAQAKALLAVHLPRIDWHDWQVRQLDEGYGITLHATMPADMPIAQAHDIAERAEMLLRGRIKNLARVTIHTEPEGSDFATQSAHSTFTGK
jgi:cation diffusion facilitator family transporter